MDIAIITGASSRIGMEYTEAAERMAGGIDELWLISGMHRHLAECAKLYDRIRVVPVPLDLSEPMSYDFIEEMLKTKNARVKMLINCCGGSFEGSFSSLSGKEALSLADLNIRTVIALEQMCLPYMTAGSFILNYGGLNREMAIPALSVTDNSRKAGKGFAAFIRGLFGHRTPKAPASVPSAPREAQPYSAFAAFLTYHSETLRIELAGAGISVFCEESVSPFDKNEIDPTIINEGAVSYGADLRDTAENSLKRAIMSSSR